MSKTIEKEDSKIIDDITKFKSEDKIQDIKIQGDILTIDIKKYNNTIKSYDYNIFNIATNGININNVELTLNDREKIQKIETDIKKQYNNNANGFELTHMKDENNEYLGIKFTEVDTVIIEKLVINNTINTTSNNINTNNYNDIIEYITNDKYYCSDGNIRTKSKTNIENSIKNTIDNITNNTNSIYLDTFISTFFIITLPIFYISMIITKVKYNNYKKGPLELILLYITIYSLLTYLKNYITNKRIYTIKNESLYNSYNRFINSFDNFDNL